MPKRQRPIISKVMQETSQSHEVRAPLIENLEKYFRKRVIVFQTSFSFENGLIEDQDATMIEEVLLSGRIRGTFLLVINSPGGIGLSAERLVQVCRRYSQNRFEVLVPHMAKSAATMVCFGARKVWMGQTSELGPIDPQLNLNRRQVSVHNILKSYDALMEKANLTTGRIEPYLQQLSVYDPRYIEQLRQAVKLSHDIAVQFLNTGMMHGKTEKDIEDKIKIFTDPETTLEHGRPIYKEQASQCGIMVTGIRPTSAIWKDIWELQLRYDYIMNSHYAKVVESADEFYSVHGHVSNTRQ